MPKSDERPTLSDVARAAGVSVTTVSYVLNGKGSIPLATRDQVKQALAGLGYLRRSPVTGRIAVVTSNPYKDPSLMTSLAECGLSHREVLLSPESPDIPDSALDGCGGILVNGGLWRRELLESLAKAKPTVFMGSFVPTVRSDAVWVDNASGIYMATDMLLRMGHKKILLLNGPGQTVTSSEKLIGFERAIRHSGSEASGTVWNATTFWYQEAYDAAKKALIGNPGITGIIGVETDMGVGALDACRDLGRSCPENISIISFRDSEWMERTEPPLSAIRLPMDGIIREAVGCLQRRMSDPALQGRRILLQPEYVGRKSVGPYEPRRS